MARWLESAVGTLAGGGPADADTDAVRELDKRALAFLEIVERGFDSVAVSTGKQAAEAFAWWRGVRPSTRNVIDAITVPLK